MVNELDLHYPPDTCPFCNIAAAFPVPSRRLWTSPFVDVADAVPIERESDPEKTSPSSFVVLAAKDVVAFLDILPMTKGHLLVATREHRVKVSDVEAEESRDMGFWLPILARVVSQVTGVTDYNIVQNNGARAAQVVPHVHFHIIPRPETMPQIQNKSWTMFGRGQRDELDDEDGASIAKEMRQMLRSELSIMDRRANAPKL
ncbi:HIT-like domain-containing protein [Lophiotrema nucula]|uniref:HIT-like domain-containing protein n=1 Tax=Lophiotrema nucula TaxID=690887 RepID=A0A6A5ZP46_9PLEO|nr:HIT-like domain-containing protein [Lophiotrema nucula]